MGGISPAGAPSVHMLFSASCPWYTLLHHRTAATAIGDSLMPVMCLRVSLVLAILTAALVLPTFAVERIIFDTDIGGDIDDAGALAVLHALADRGEIELLAIGIVNGHENAVPYTDAINTWYGRPALPIGTIKQGEPFRRDTYMATVVRTCPHDLTKAAAPDVVPLYRRLLAAQPDRSVTLVAVGPATNVSRLLDSGPDEASPWNGVELVRRKVRFYAAGGNANGGLPAGKCGFNYQMDQRSASNELAKLPGDWPTIFAGGSGSKLKIGSCYRDAPANHLIRNSYEAYFRGKPDLDRPTWDQLRVLYAARPASRNLFETSAPGEILLDKDGLLTWTAQPDRNRAFAYVKDVARVRSELTALMMHGPETDGRAASQP